MAVHAGFGRRNAREARGLYRGMAVAAVNPKAGHVVLMTEGNRLRPGYSGVSHIGRPLNLGRCPEQRRHDKNGSINRGAGNGVRTAMKDLHRTSSAAGTT